MNRKCTNLPFLVLMQTSKEIHERMKLEMTKYNLSITEFSVLEVLYNKGKQTIQQIGHRILITSGSMTYVIDRLEQKGMLNRSACPNDRRAIHVALTANGNSLMEEIMPKHQELVNNMFGSLDSHESELLVKLLKKVSSER
ncbi:MarR family 2-MHQ and catechol resistance regulon transcriptional repressor [Bacillus sp. SLBN-46]|jgi:MarR family transcriptional regulator, 2-MHQ and catechol-resistance regulon repressor|uniref:MarR family winged helix-turn-helix transcriptional regulator n=1 Tax=Bacillus sp. SLBN-46 TaxID=3042283 RepID=UPI00285C6E3D|nr:MarR family transcriptional regulator [Bacillus sp. SLBN-46]MDR6121082.1 MarR family 2-MHQ and catechol resistance regulon transcriptional repressor [Bacillus sp. SLBN-46]